MASRTLYIIYNADATLMGKLRYGYRKLSSSGSEAACAACDITHGGLSLKESPQWLDSKMEIERSDLKVVQWHRDEVNSDLKSFVQSHELRYPVAVLQSKEGEFTTIMTSTELNACKGEPRALVDELRNKGILPKKESPPTPSL